VIQRNVLLCDHSNSRHVSLQTYNTAVGCCLLHACERTMPLFTPSLQSTPVVPKLVRAVTQIKERLCLNYPQYFAVIAHNIEQHCGFVSALPPEESHITPGGDFPPV